MLLSNSYFQCLFKDLIWTTLEPGESTLSPSQFQSVRSWHREQMAMSSENLSTWMVMLEKPNSDSRSFVASMRTTCGLASSSRKQINKQTIRFVFKLVQDWFWLKTQMISNNYHCLFSWFDR